MTVEVFRSAVFAAKAETTKGELIAPLAADFIPMRPGATMSAAVETITTDELFNSIGQSKSFIAKENPTGSFPKYARHSGVEGTEPEYGVMIYSAMGNKAVEGTERTTASSSTAGDTSAAAVIKVSDGTQHRVGKALLIKDNANNIFTVRNIASISTNDLTMAFNITAAPGSGVGLGKPIHYYPANTGHPSFSAYMWQAATSSAVFQAFAGCQTSKMTWNFPVNNFAEVTFDYNGIKAYLNPITITSSTEVIDFSVSSTPYAASVDVKTYQSPHELARELESKMNAEGSAVTFSVIFDDENGKFIIAGDGTFSILWNTGTNAASSIGTKLGFSVAADDTSAASYTADNVLTYSPAVTPSYDSVDNLVVKGAELLIGDYYHMDCRKFTSCTFTIDTPTVDIESACSETGIEERIVTNRTATMSATILLAEHEAMFFDKMINNTTTKIALTAGQKSSGNWVPGSIVNIFFRNCTITASAISESNGVLVYNVEATAHVDATSDDVHINFL